MSITKDFYTVFIVDNGNKPVKKLDEYVFALKHGEEYKIKMTNHHSELRANASISVDGKNIGYYRIEKDSTITIERPAKQERRLTFFKNGTKEAIKGGLNSSNPDQGILKVTFEQENEPEFVHQVCLNSGSMFPQSDISRSLGGYDTTDFSLGGTALGRVSTQKFTSAVHMKTKEQVVVIQALMVVDEQEASSDIIPL